MLGNSTSLIETSMPERDFTTFTRDKQAEVLPRGLLSWILCALGHLIKGWR
jgi:hypothetical protein